MKTLIDTHAQGLRAREVGCGRLSSATIGWLRTLFLPRLVCINACVCAWEEGGVREWDHGCVTPCVVGFPSLKVAVLSFSSICIHLAVPLAPVDLVVGVGSPKEEGWHSSGFIFQGTSCFSRPPWFFYYFFLLPVREQFMTLCCALMFFLVEYIF